MQKPLVSIIIPTYNRAHLIGETLDSIIAQTYKNWECIIVDDGSEDNSLEIINNFLAKDTRFKYYQRPKTKPKGANACRNYGFEKSKGELIKWFDSDDLMLPTMLEKKHEVLNKNHDFVLCNCIFFDTEKNNKWFEDIVIEGSFLLSYFTNKITFNTQNTLWRREIVLGYKFDEKLQRAQELDFFSKIMLKENLKGSIIDEKLVLIRVHEKSITGAYLQGDKTKIFDDINVRFYIFNNLNKSIPKNQKDKIFYGYLKTLKKALENKYFSKIILHLLNSIFKIKLEYKLAMLRVLFFCFIYVLTGKGWERMKKGVLKS